MNMELMLTQSDLDRLAAMLGEIPHKYAAPIVQFIAVKVTEANRQAAASVTQLHAAQN